MWNEDGWAPGRRQYVAVMRYRARPCETGLLTELSAAAPTPRRALHDCTLWWNFIIENPCRPPKQPQYSRLGSCRGRGVIPGSDTVWFDRVALVRSPAKTGRTTPHRRPSIGDGPKSLCLHLLGPIRVFSDRIRVTSWRVLVACRRRI